MPPDSHSAWYDEEGNIILPGVNGRVAGKKEGEVVERKVPDVLDDEATEIAAVVDEAPAPVAPPRSVRAVAWEVTDPAWQEVVDTKEHAATVEVWRELRGKVAAVTADVLLESGRQYRTSLADGGTMLQRSLDGLRDGAARTWAFLTQPVWVPGRRNEPRKYSRGMLFVLDVVRFGGTFAFLFTVLFASLNFQSFWQIMKARVDPLADSAKTHELEEDLTGTLADKLRHVPSLAVAGGTQGDLLSLVPDVGPPVPTLIVPKLGLNVPIVIPANEALLREDWKKLEEDIQTGLQNGVVHYPGTARPGQAGNFFVTGHSSYFPWDPGKYKSVFARLGDLEPGDEYWIYYGGDKYRYRITEKREVRPDDVTVLDQPTKKRMGTLMTCTPVGTTLRRLVLESQEVDPVTGQPLAVGDHGHRGDVPQVKVETLPI